MTKSTDGKRSSRLARKLRDTARKRTRASNEITSVALTRILGRLIAAVRQELDASQASFAEMLRMSQSGLARLEIGEAKINIDVLWVLRRPLRQLDLFPSDLLDCLEDAARRLRRQGVKVSRNPPDDPQTEASLALVDRVVGACLQDLITDVHEEEGEDLGEDWDDEF